MKDFDLGSGQIADDLPGKAPHSQGRSGLAILQHQDNPGHPHPWREYARLNFFQPIYPGGELIPMPQGKTITLRYRLWIHAGDVTNKHLAGAWDAYHKDFEQTEGGRP